MPSDENTPPKAAKGQRKPFLLRLPPELLDELKGWASQEFRSLNGHLEFLLRDALRKRKGGPEKGGPAPSARPTKEDPEEDAP